MITFEQEALNQTRGEHQLITQPGFLFPFFFFSSLFDKNSMCHVLLAPCISKWLMQFVSYIVVGVLCPVYLYCHLKAKHTSKYIYSQKFYEVFYAIKTIISKTKVGNTRTAITVIKKWDLYKVHNSAITDCPRDQWSTKLNNTVRRRHNFLNEHDLQSFPFKNFDF